MLRANFERLRNTTYIKKYKDGIIHHDVLPAQKEMVVCVCGFPGTVPAPAASAAQGNLLDVQVIRLHLRLTKSETMGIVLCSLCFKSPPGDSTAPLRTTDPGSKKFDKNDLDIVL